jgi:hypothetical protein
MDAALDVQVRNRAGGCCEYCRIPEMPYALSFELDHIIAEKHRGKTEAGNLALSCVHCNRHKGPCIAGIDPETDQIVRRYHPRRDKWREHFRWNGIVLVGLTDVGRTTIEVLEINDEDSVRFRQQLVEVGLFSPQP